MENISEKIGPGSYRQFSQVIFISIHSRVSGLPKNINILREVPLTRHIVHNMVAALNPTTISTNFLYLYRLAYKNFRQKKKNLQFYLNHLFECVSWREQKKLKFSVVGGRVIELIFASCKQYKVDCHRQHF